MVMRTDCGRYRYFPAPPGNVIAPRPTGAEEDSKEGLRAGLFTKIQKILYLDKENLLLPIALLGKTCYDVRNSRMILVIPRKEKGDCEHDQRQSEVRSLL